jgi:putative oxidoreductase
MGDAALPILARLVFAGVLAGYFWSSALTKFDGPLTPSLGGYAQIFPRAFEAVGYDSTAMNLLQWAVVMAGGLAEFILPALIMLGLATRLAALGMAGFVIVQSLTDVFGHLASPGTIGAWFDRASDALILDQRALWLLLLALLVFRGAGAFSIDRMATAALNRRNGA